MGLPAEKIIAEALQLPSTLRALVAERLIESLDIEESGEVTPEWREEIVRRCREIDEKIRMNHYDATRVRELLDQLPTMQKGKLLYEALLIGLEKLEQEYGIPFANEGAEEGRNVATYRIAEARIGIPHSAACERNGY